MGTWTAGVGGSLGGEGPSAASQLGGDHSHTLQVNRFHQKRSDFISNSNGSIFHGTFTDAVDIL